MLGIRCGSDHSGASREGAPDEPEHVGSFLPEGVTGQSGHWRFR